MSDVQVKKNKATCQFESFVQACGISDPAGGDILEVGFKEGRFLEECLQKGMSPAGLEVEKGYYDSASKRLKGIGLYHYEGHRFPVEESSFDYVVSFQVLEHVGSVEDVITECIRVLKPGGMMYHVCPNYKSFYEGHFNCIWLPFLNKRLGRGYLKLIGKYRPYYEHLQIIKPKKIKAILDKQGDEIEVVSLGRKEFSGQLTLSQIKKVKQPVLNKILALFYRVPFLAKAAFLITGWMGLYYPMTIIARKRIMSGNV